MPYTTYGWSASELIVQDVDQLADDLADSPFEIIGPPKNLSFTDDIRAMQVLGPANEILYLTQVKDNVPGWSGTLDYALEQSMLMKSNRAWKNL